MSSGNNGLNGADLVILAAIESAKSTISTPNRADG